MHASFSRLRTVFLAKESISPWVFVMESLVCKWVQSHQQLDLRQQVARTSQPASMRCHAHHSLNCTISIAIGTLRLDADTLFRDQWFTVRQFVILQEELLVEMNFCSTLAQAAHTQDTFCVVCCVELVSFRGRSDLHPQRVSCRRSVLPSDPRSRTRSSVELAPVFPNHRDRH